MNKLGPFSIKFTIEMQTDNKLPFLGVIVERRSSQLIIYVYRKPTDTDLYFKSTSNQHRHYKMNLIKSLSTRATRTQTRIRIL